MTDKKAFFWAAVLLGVLCLFCVPALAGENAGEQPETGTQDPEESQWQRQLDQKWDSALEDTDFEELEQAMEEALETDQISFAELAKGLASGKIKPDMELVRELVNKGVFGNMKGAKGILTQILALSILSAFFSMIASIFGNGQVSDISFYVVFLILLALLMSSFARASKIASETIEKLLLFVKVMMPVYMVIVAAAGGGTTAVVFYEFFLFLAFVVNWLILRVLIPMIHVYVVMGVVNHLSKEDLFSKAADLIRTAVKWALKTIVGLVIGFQLLQSLIAPFIDSFRSASLHRTLMSIPGVGNAINGITEMAIGAGILIKNGMGSAALIVIVLICLTPVLMLGVYVFLFQLSRALIQPVADKRIQKCIGYVREGTALLMRTLMITCFLFLLTVAVLTASTNGGIS